MEGDEIQDGSALQESWAGPQSTLLSEIEQTSTEQPGSNVLETELKGDAIPEQFRGKKLSDVLTTLGGMKDALRASEEARQQALATMQALAEGRQTQAAQPAPAATPAEPAEPTDAEMKELFERDQFAYQQKRFEMLEKR